MSLKNRAARRTSIRKRRTRGLTSAQVKIFSALDYGRSCCCLPSCGARGDPETFFKHHWDFSGHRGISYLCPEAIHLLCGECHHLVHLIALSIVRVLGVKKINADELVRRIVRLEIREEDVRFVLFEEMVRAGIVVIKDNVCFLDSKKNRRVRKIVLYGNYVNAKKRREHA